MKKYTQSQKYLQFMRKRARRSAKARKRFKAYGVGVFNSLRNKRPGSKFYGAIDKLRERVLDRITLHSDPGILKLIFEGELHRTATGKTYRGKGLPGIYEALQKNHISNLSMITNGVFYNSSTNEFVPLHNQFEGTFVYFELTATNAKLN